jgi:predicted RNA-binding protein (virulence factor B family)
MRACRVLWRAVPGSRHEGVVTRVTRVGVTLELDDIGEVLVHSTNVFDDTIRIGQYIPVYITKVREEDGKIDAMFSPPRSVVTLDRDSTRVKAALVAHDGHLPLGDKSKPDDIREMLRMSKTSFKAALGRLKKHNLIEISAHWVVAKTQSNTE